MKGASNITMNPDELLVKIEHLRNKMIELGLASTFIDDRVVQISDQLDQLLNKYHRLSNHHKSL